MNHNHQKNIYVYADWSELFEHSLVGTLHSVLSRGQEIFSFEYDSKWLKQKSAYALDPSLQLFSGRQYAPVEKRNFGIFLDSSPDRWGRMLMDRRTAQLARDKKEQLPKLLESDYLLGVYDEHRMGALRFRTHPNGPFLDDNKTNASPPWTSLRELENASLELEKDNAENKPAYSRWLQMLIAPGGSLGGARPKASVVDEHHHLWIAKFPSNNDKYNIGAWEMVAFNLAKKAGIKVTEAKIKKFNSKYDTFLNKRFDRTISLKRIHFASAMTLLQRNDGDNHLIGASYLELAEFLMQQGAQPEQDLEELWRRIVFYICISNVDDHLRNHGFILQPNGWILSPAFDINPVSDGNGLTLNISETENSQDLDLAREVAAFFRIKPNEANKIIKEVTTSVKTWRKSAQSLGISELDQNKMSQAFRVADNIK